MSLLSFSNLTYNKSIIFNVDDFKDVSILIKPSTKTRFHLLKINPRSYEPLKIWASLSYIQKYLISKYLLLSQLNTALLQTIFGNIIWR